MVKTITITDEAYHEIKNMKMVNESFSDLFRRLASRKLKVREIIGILGTSESDAKEWHERIKKMKGEDLKLEVKRDELIRQLYSN